MTRAVQFLDQLAGYILVAIGAAVGWALNGVCALIDRAEQD